LARKSKWEDIAAVIRSRITSGELEQGGPFPTNFELMKEFDVHIGTAQNAVNALINEGLVITHGSGTQKRTVRRLIDRSVRVGGFMTEYKDRGRQKILWLGIINNSNELPEYVLNDMQLPVLMYKTLQLRDDVPVAISTSYLPNTFRLNYLYDLLYNPKNELYEIMRTLGFNPINCQESLIIDHASPDECNLFTFPETNSLTVVRITRKVYDDEGNLLELCKLTDRADAYEFVYHFPLNSN
jgi:GntR family transcriptional regulator